MCTYDIIPSAFLDGINNTSNINTKKTHQNNKPDGESC